jgi:hypothetical protein
MPCSTPFMRVPMPSRSKSERTNIAPARTVPANWVGTVHGVFPVSDSSGSQSLLRDRRRIEIDCRRDLSNAVDGVGPNSDAAALI